MKKRKNKRKKKTKGIRSRILDKFQVQDIGNLGPGFWKGLKWLVLMILYSIKSCFGSRILDRVAKKRFIKGKERNGKIVKIELIFVIITILFSIFGFILISYDGNGKNMITGFTSFSIYPEESLTPETTNKTFTIPIIEHGDGEVLKDGEGDLNFEIQPIENLSTQTGEESQFTIQPNETIQLGIMAAISSSAPLLNSTNPATNDTNQNLTCWNQSQTGVVKNIYNWFKDDASIMVLNMPFEKNDTNTATVTADLSPYKNDGVVSGATWNKSSGYDGKGAYDFDGKDDYINITGVASDLSSTTVGTWSAWIKLNDATPSDPDHIIMFGDASSNEQILFNINQSGNFRATTYTQVGGSVIKWELTTDAPAVNADTWHHVALVQDGTEPDLYVDGVKPAQTFIVTTDKTYWFSDFGGIIDTGSIGRFYNAVANIQYFNGTLDEVRIYDLILSANQIKALYNNQTNLIHSDETSLGDKWKCQETPFNTTSANPQLNSSELEILIIPTAPTVSLVSPKNDSSYISNIFTYNITDPNDNIDNCTLWIENSTGLAIGEIDTSVTAGQNNFTITLPYEKINWSIGCTDTTNLKGNSSEWIYTYLSIRSTTEDWMVDSNFENNLININKTARDINSAIMATPLATYNNHIYTCYVDGNLNVIVAKSTNRGETWTTTTIHTGNADDGHNYCSLGIDSDGYIHVSYDMHITALNYKVSDNPEDISSFSAGAMTGTAETQVTYPAFYISPTDVLYFVYRDGISGNGDLHIRNYSTSSQTWFDFAAPLINGKTMTPKNNPYRDTLVWDSNNNMHLSWTYRNQTPVAPSGAILNFNVSYAMYNVTSTQWEKTDGTAYTLPINSSTSETVESTSMFDRLSNQNSAYVDSYNRMHILFIKNDSYGFSEIFHSYYNTTDWVTTEATDLNTTYESVIWDLGRPQIAIDSIDNIYVFFTNGSHSDLIGTLHYTKSTDNGTTWSTPSSVHLPNDGRGFEFSYDHSYFRDTNDLRFFFQTRDSTTSPLYIIEEKNLDKMLEATESAATNKSINMSRGQLTLNGSTFGEYISPFHIWTTKVIYEDIIINALLNNQSATAVIQTSNDKFSSISSIFSIIIKNGINLYSIILQNNDRYVRLNITLNTSDTTITPTIYMFNITTNNLTNNIYYNTSDSIKNTVFTNLTIDWDRGISRYDTKFSNFTVVPTSNKVNITINHYNSSAGIRIILLNFTGDTTNGNNINFTLGSLTAATNYSIKKAGVLLTTKIANSSGFIEFNNSGWSEQEFTIEETSGNNAPTISTIYIYSDADTRNDTNVNLTGTFSVNDADADSMTANETRWYNNSIEVTSLKNSTTVTYGNTTKGENWMFSARTFDGTDWSIWTNSSNFTILNAKPFINQYYIYSDDDTINTTIVNLTLTFSITDSDSDSMVTNETRWYNNSIYESGLDNFTTIMFGNTSKDDDWVAEFRTTDGTDWSVWMNTSNFTILNTAPTIPLIFIKADDSTNHTNTNLTYVFSVSDIDSDSMILNETRWYNNSIYESNLDNSTIVYYGNTTGLENWLVEARTHDGTDWSAWTNSSNLTIENYYPLIYLVSPADSDSSSTSSVTFTFNVSDHDELLNCSLVIDGSKVAHNSSQIYRNQSNIEITHTLSNNDYNWNINCTDSLLYENNSASRSLNVNKPSTVEESPPSGFGSGSGAGSPGGTGSYISEIEQIEYGTVYTIPTFITPITMNTENILEYIISLTVTPARETSNAKITIEELNNIQIEKPNIDNIIFVKVTTENLPTSNIYQAVFYFKVPKKQINNIIEFQQYDNNKWRRLQTKLVDSDDDFNYYESSTTSLSYFAITTYKKQFPFTFKFKPKVFLEKLILLKNKIKDYIIPIIIIVFLLISIILIRKLKHKKKSNKRKK